MTVSACFGGAWPEQRKHMSGTDSSAHEQAREPLDAGLVGYGTVPRLAALCMQDHEVWETAGLALVVLVFGVACWPS